MLARYKVKNFLSIQNEEEISLYASKSLKPFSETLNKGEILPVISMYGPNGGGKTAFLSSIFYLIVLVKTDRVNLQVYIDETKRFRNKETINEPISWYIEFLTDNLETLCYSISIDDKIIEEKYVIKQNKKERVIFSKTNDGDKISFYLDDVLKTNFGKIDIASLDVSLFNFFNMFPSKEIKMLQNEFSKIIIFDNTTNVSNVLMPSLLMPFRTSCLNIGILMHNKDKILTILKELDINIIDIKNPKGNTNPDKITFVKESLYGENFEVAYNYESSGTRKLLLLLTIMVTGLKNNSIILIDELDANLHTKILEYIIKMFKKNPGTAQLIYTSHDMNTLSEDLFRRDEIYFAALNESKFTNVVCLNEFGSTIRGKCSFSNQYLSGKIGYDPYINYALRWLDDEK